MASFSEVESNSNSFAEKIESITELTIDEITLDPPSNQGDELDFVKIVSWAYVALFEAHSIPRAAIFDLIKASDSHTHQKINQTLNSIRALRTKLHHNLPKSSSNNEKTRTTANAWLISNAGQPTDWSKACNSLLEQTLYIFMEMLAAIDRSTQNGDDVQALKSSLLLRMSNQWPPHLFERMIRKSLTTLNIQGMDIPSYTESRLKTFRDYIRLFSNPDDALNAIDRIVHNDLVNTFGHAPPA